MVFKPFENHADRYDAWFERFPGNQIFSTEIACVERATGSIPHPWLEVGVGTGRFAHALGVDEGIDPAVAALNLAKLKGIKVRQGLAETLPYPDSTFGGIFMLITLCFLDDPSAGIRECHRVLRDKGRFILGIVPADSAWGKFYSDRKRAHHLFYETVNLFTVSEVSNLIEKSDFRIEGIWSTLLTPPGQDDYPFSEPVEGIVPDAGFVVLRATRI